jgi:hypothetical protein
MIILDPTKSKVPVSAGSEFGKHRIEKQNVCNLIQYCGSASFDADPDHTFHFDADPDPDPDLDPTPNFTLRTFFEFYSQQCPFTLRNISSHCHMCQIFNILDSILKLYGKRTLALHLVEMNMDPDLPK